MDDLRLRAVAERVRAADSEALREVLDDLLQRPAVRGAWLRALAGPPPHTHRLATVGPAGVGKSSLLVRLAESLVSSGQRVGVLALDATRGFDGGFDRLGDRPRWVDVDDRDGLFVHRVRWSPQGESPALVASLLAFAMDAAGFDLVLVDTAGFGRHQFEVTEGADTRALIVPAGLDSPERLAEGGLFAGADLVVVHPSDHEGAEATWRSLRAAGLRNAEDGSDLPVLLAGARRGDGLDALLEVLDRRRRRGPLDGGSAARRRHRARLLVESLTVSLFAQGLESDPGLDRVAASVASGDCDPVTAAERILVQRRNS